MMQTIRGAFSRINGRLFLSQWVGNFLLMLLAAGWMQVPDSHAWQFLFSILSGVLLVVAFLWLYTATFRHLLVCAPRLPWWVSCAHEALYAGYWNSQSPRWLRYRLGYSSLVAWQERIYDCVQWLLAGLLLPLAVVTCACGVGVAAFRRAGMVYRHWLYWLCILVCGWGGAAITWALADWTPAAGLLGQSFSIVARLGIAYTIDILLWCFLLALVATYLGASSEKNKGTEEGQVSASRK
jgi:MFS family permease